MKRILHGFLWIFPVLLITGILSLLLLDKLQYFREHTLNFPLSCNLPHFSSSVLNKTLWVSLMPPPWCKSSPLTFSCHSVKSDTIQMQMKTWLHNSHTPLCAFLWSGVPKAPGHPACCFLAHTQGRAHCRDSWANHDANSVINQSLKFH